MRNYFGDSWKSHPNPSPKNRLPAGNPNRMKKLILLIAAATSLGTWTVSTALAQEEKVTVAQDESSVELIIETYLTKVHQLVLTEKRNGDDLWLNMAMKGDPMSSYRITIDTQPLNKDKAGRIIERGIRIQAMTGVKVSEAQRPAVIRIINDFNRDKVFAAAYVDSDGEVMLDWTLNILEPGLDLAYVYDVLTREDRLWHELYPRVNAAMN